MINIREKGSAPWTSRKAENRRHRRKSRRAGIPRHGPRGRPPDRPERGGVLVCGGLGGVMEAAARGAKEAGRADDRDPSGKPARRSQSRSSTFPSPRAWDITRNSLVAMNADVLIAVDGEYGTLSEIAFGPSTAKRSSASGRGISKASFGPTARATPSIAPSALRPELARPAITMRNYQDRPEL